MLTAEQSIIQNVTKGNIPVHIIKTTPTMWASPCPQSMYLVGVLLMTVASDVTSQADMTSQHRKFKAAVYEHAVVLPDVGNTTTRLKALAAMEKNVATYRQQTTIAATLGADIIVFPEDGLYGFAFNSRAAILPFLETIPDPGQIKWSACSDPDRFPDTEVQHQLSCMAKNNSVYLVANMGDKQHCDVTSDPKCPHDGHYQYNTAVAFDPDGTLVARYHKTHLFYEDQFDTPDPKSAYFDTPFGRFGLFVCFDVMFYDPAVAMVTRDNVTNVAFPTAWMDALPLLSAVGFHSSFARGLGVNFLAANLHLPGRRFQGSGIYSPGGAREFYYNNSISSPGKLLVTELDVLQTRQLQEEDQSVRQLPVENHNMASSEPCTDSSSSGSNGKCPTMSSDVEETLTRSEPEEFKSELFGDMFTFRALTNDSGFSSVYQNHVGCHLNYSKEDISKTGEMFALGAFDGLHTKEGQYYFQICALVRCASSTNRSSCGSTTDESQTRFTRLELRGELQVDYIYPQLMLRLSDKNLGLASPESWDYDHMTTTLTTRPDLVDHVLSAALFGRWYSRDSGGMGGVEGLGAGTPGGPRGSSHLANGNMVAILSALAFSVAMVFFC